MSERIGVIMQRQFEACTLELGDRASHIGDVEDWLEARDHPLLVMSCNWSLRCPFSRARQLWQIGWSGCDRS